MILALIPHCINIIGNVNRLAPGSTIVVTVETCDILVVVTGTAGERNVTCTAENHHLRALSIGNDTGVTKAYVHKVGRLLALTLDDGENLAPGLTVILAYTSVKVDTAIACHSNIGTTVTVVGNSNNIAIRCCCNGRDTIRNSRRCRCGEHLEVRLGLLSIGTQCHAEIRECDTLVCTALNK